MNVCLIIDSDNDCNCNNNDADYNDDYCLMNDKVNCDSMNDLTFAK